jgi:hypothetical protein
VRKKNPPNYDMRKMGVTANPPCRAGAGGKKILRMMGATSNPSSRAGGSLLGITVEFPLVQKVCILIPFPHPLMIASSIHPSIHPFIHSNIIVRPETLNLDEVQAF